VPFPEFFQRAYGDDREPYDYQIRLACGGGASSEKPETLENGCECKSQLIHIPAGLGKTRAVAMAWLWNRVHWQYPQWPRRLVSCLPMRTLVEQTEIEIGKWLSAHKLSIASTGPLSLSKNESVFVPPIPDREANRQRRNSSEHSAR
jgi:CRISPR/Cas system-associated endonuclease/helicase Cas3